MKRKMMRCFSVLLGLTLALGFFAAANTAASAASYGLWVQGIQVTDANKGNVLNDAGKTVQFEPGTNASGTLILNNANISGAEVNGFKIFTAGIDSRLNTLMIKLKGTSKITGTPATGTSCGIYYLEKAIIFRDDDNGKGKLDITLEQNNYCAALYGANLTMESGTVTAIVKTGESAFLEKQLIVNGGSLTCTSMGGHSSYGVNVFDGTTVNGGTLTAIGQNKAILGELNFDNYTNRFVTVNEEAKAENASPWDGSSRLNGANSKYKYVKIGPSTDVTIAGGDVTKTYGDGSITLNATVKTSGVNGKWSWKSDNTEVATVSGNGGSARVTVKNAGSAKLSAFYQSDTAAGVDEIELTVKPKELTVTGLAAPDHTYDGKTEVKLTGGVLSGVVSGDEGKVTAAMPQSGTITDANVGADKPVSFADITLSGDAAKNYTLNQQPKVTVNVVKAAIAPEVTVADWTYGETASTPALTGNPGDGAVKYEYKAADAGEDAYEEEVPENAGQYTVRATVAETANYEGNTATTDFEIKKAAIAPAVTIESWTYGEAAKTPALAGNTDNGTVTYEYKAADAGEDAYKEEVPENAGQYTLRATVAATANYEGNTATTDFEIKKAPIIPEVTIEAWTYGETASMPVVTGNPGEGAVKAEYKPESAPESEYKEAVPTAVGKYTLRATVAESDNYLGNTATTTFEIFPAMTVPVTENGSVTLEPADAKPGEKVTVTPQPAEGYDGEVIVTDDDGEEVPVTKNDDGAFTFTMPEANVTVTPTFEPCPGYKFTDVDRDDWYHDYVDYVIEKGLMKGITATTFEPETATSRAMLVMTLYRLAGEQEISGKSPFKDVKDDSWYGKAVIWAYENKIVDGYGGGKFGPNDPVTREQLVTIFFRYSGKMGYDVKARGDLTKFKDENQISAYAKEAMSWAVAVGLVEGMNDGTVAPKDNSTRAQVAAILTRFCENLMK